MAQGDETALDHHQSCISREAKTVPAATNPATLSSSRISCRIEDFANELVCASPPLKALEPGMLMGQGNVHGHGLRLMVVHEEFPVEDWHH